MTRRFSPVLSVALVAGMAVSNGQQPQQAAPPTPAKAPTPKKSTTPAKAAPAPMTNQDVIRLVKARISDEMIISKVSVRPSPWFGKLHRWRTESTDGPISLLVCLAENV